MPRREHLNVELAVDLAILTVREAALQVLVITRRNEPFARQHALPGGFLHPDEDLHEAAVRELKEETALSGTDLHLEQLAAYAAPDRDPRGRVVSVAYLGFMPDLPLPIAGSDAATAFWAPVDAVAGTLAFDHDQILEDAVEQARIRLEMTTLATAFCPPRFTMADLRQVYEVVWSEHLDPRNFSRKVLGSQGFVTTTSGKRAPKTGRPATLYERGGAIRMVPPLLRDES